MAFRKALWMHTRGGKSDNEIENLNDDIISTEKYSRVAIEYFNIGDVPPWRADTWMAKSHNIQNILSLCKTEVYEPS